MIGPLPFIYFGEGVFHASSPHFAKVCDHAFTKGQRVLLIEQSERTPQSHAHFFASIHDTWANLPDHLAVEFPTPEILRKHALIMSGFRRERKFAASSAAEARKIAAFLRPQERSDDYAIISVHGSLIVEWKAMSQSYSAMPKGVFQKSKTAVIEYLADMIKVDPETLKREAGRAA
jgi:hypothetical protein